MKRKEALTIMAPVTRRLLLRSAGGSVALAVPTLLHTQTNPSEWDGVSPSVIQNAAQFVVPAYQMEGRARPRPALTQNHWGAAYAGLTGMFAQWEECGFAARLNQHLNEYLAQVATFDFQGIGERMRTGYGWILPPQWWEPGLRAVKSLQSPISFQQLYGAILRTTGKKALLGADLPRRAIAEFWWPEIVKAQDYDLEIQWTKVGGILLILSGAIGLAFGTPIIVAAGLAVIAIGVAFVAL